MYDVERIILVMIAVEKSPSSASWGGLRLRKKLSRVQCLAPM